MSEYNTKNYTEQGGEVTHIGGTLIIEDGATVEGLSGGGGSGYILPTASASTLGGVKVGEGLTITDGVLSTTGSDFQMAEGVADSTATDVTDLRDDFNALLASLRSAGIIGGDSSD